MSTTHVKTCEIQTCKNTLSDCELQVLPIEDKQRTTVSLGSKGTVRSNFNSQDTDPRREQSLSLDSVLQNGILVLEDAVLWYVDHSSVSPYP